MDISVVIPCYNSEKTITSVIDRLIKTLESRDVYKYEIILINDDSKDNVYSVIKSLCASNEKIKAINLSKNFGQYSALMAGYRTSSGNVVVSLDDDGQNPPEQLFKLVDRLSDDCDVAMAYYEKKKHSKFRNFGSKVNQIMAQKLMGKPKDLQATSYVAFKRFVINEIVKYENSYPYILGLTLRTTDKIRNVKIDHIERQSGDSGYTFKKLFSLWLDGFTAFSIKPLRIATITGMVVASIGFIGIIWVIAEKIHDPTVPIGWSSMMTAMLFLFGIVLMVLGLIGEYLGRLYMSANNSPQYVIRDRINF